MESTNSRALISFWPFLGGGIIQRSIINIATAMFMERDWYLARKIVLKRKKYSHQLYSGIRHTSTRFKLQS